MDKESRYLIHLLRAYLNNETPQALPEADWKRLLELARSHNLTGTLGYMTMCHPICPDPELCRYLRRRTMENLVGFSRRGELAGEFSAALARQGIDHIVMKGYVLRRFYPVPELRTFGDIDLVIRPGDRQRCHGLMQELGFQTKTDWEPVYTYLRENEYYELHTQLLEVDVSEKADYRGYFRDLWDHVTEREPHCYEFEPEYHFLYLLVHIAKHIVGSGAGVRMYLDIAVFLQHYGSALDWDRVRRELEKLKLTAFANAVLTLVQEQLGVRSPLLLTPIEAQVREDFLEFTVAGGVFGKESRDSGVNSLKNESRGGAEATRIGTIAKRLFPSAQTIRSRYTYLQDKPWLLPAAWVHRLVKTRDRLRDHTQEMQQILSADKGEVQALTRLYEQLGL